MNPSLKANLMDSLQLLMEVNMKIQQFQEKEITEKEFHEFIERRSKEFGYIADYSHTFKIMEQLRNIS